MPGRRDVVEIVDADLDRPLRAARPRAGMRGALLLGFTGLFIAVGGFGVWATTAPLESGVVAPGTLTLWGKRKQVQNLDGGIIKSFKVKDGDRVEKGDVLIEFDPLIPATHVAMARVGFLAALAAEARLLAERDGAATIAWPDELASEAAQDPRVQALVRSQQQLFEARRTQNAGDTHILESRIAQLKDQISGFEQERSASTQQLDMARQEQETVADLYAKQYTTRDRVLSIKREIFQLEGNIGALTAQMAAANKEVGETELSLAQINNKTMTDVLDQLKEAQARVLDLREQYDAARGELDRTLVRAPASGIVFNSQVHTVGGVVRGGETLLEIVPSDGPLVVEVRLRPQDVDSVQVGQSTEIKLTAFKQRTTPPLSGKVIFVSADTVTEPHSGQTYYVADIQPDGQSLGELAKLHMQLQPGMPAETLINTGKRTAMAYLMQPLADSMSRAWREK